MCIRDSYIAVPALIIKFVAQSEIGQVDLKQIISYFLMQSICGIFTFIITSKFFKRPIAESIIWALTVALSNHVTLLLPITQIYFSEEVVTQVASIILMDGVILLSLIAFFLMIRRPPRSTQSRSSAASDVYKRQLYSSSSFNN